jgi:hypothetical protein
MDAIPRNGETTVLGPDSFITFETEGRVRLVRKVFLVISILLISPLLALGYFAIGIILTAFHLSLWVVIPMVLFVALITLRWIFRRIFSGFRFCIIFLPDHLQVGRGTARCCLRYDDVEIVSLARIAPRSFDAQYTPANLDLRLQCGKRRVGVNLNSAKMGECVAYIRRYCPNALLVDQEGHVRFPLNAMRAEQTLISLERHYSRIAWESFALAGILGSLSVLTLTHWLPQRFNIHHGYFFAGFSVAVVSACEGWASLSKCAEIRKKRMDAQQPADQSEAI